jgi:anti-anti-sigma factor
MAQLEISEVERSAQASYAVLSLDGEIDLHTVGELKKHLSALEGAHLQSVILDMAKTSFVNSSALAVLVKFAQTFKERGGGIALTNVNARVKMPFEMLGLLVFFQFFETVDQAKKSLPGGE